MKCLTLYLFIFILNTTLVKAQILKDEVYKKNILSVKFYPEGWELGYPILLNENKTNLILSFDLMGEEQPALAYRILHCNANWEKSKVITSDYLKNSFNEFYIEEYHLSTGTKRLYTNYDATIDKEQLKISGNYVIQIFQEDDPEKVWLQQRFLYVESQVEITAEISNTNAAYHLKEKQRVDFDVAYNKRDFPHPRTNFTAVVSQNFRWDTQNAQSLSPLFIDNNNLNFNYVDKRGLFNGNYEFPYFDTSDILRGTHTIRTLEHDEKNEVHCYLYPNEVKTRNYFYMKDMNGNFIFTAKNTFSAATEADYVWVHFTLVSPELDDKVYVLGSFNQWQPSENSLLSYDKEMQLYHLGLLLKQGVYNYTFASKNKEGMLKNLLGSYKETENDYYIFIYYRDERLQADRLVGWRRLNSVKK